MTLDALYGPGSLAALTLVVNTARHGATVTQADLPNGCVVTILWGADICRMECNPETVHFTYLSTTCNSLVAKREVSNALYTSLCTNLPPILKAHGVRWLTAGTFDPASTATLMSIGGFVPKAGLLVWEL